MVLYIGYQVVQKPWTQTATRKNYGFFAPLPVRPWLFRPLARSLLTDSPLGFSPGLFDPRLFRRLACSPPG